MTQEELQIRLGESLKRAIRKYRKDGGKLPNCTVGTVVNVIDDGGESWELLVSCGSIEAPGEIFIQPL